MNNIILLYVCIYMYDSKIYTDCVLIFTPTNRNAATVTAAPSSRRRTAAEVRRPYTILAIADYTRNGISYRNSGAVNSATTANTSTGSDR